MKKTKWVFLFIALFALLMVPFLEAVEPDMNGRIDIEKEKARLLELDREMASVSASQGILNAFFPLMTEQSMLLPTKGHPIYGKKVCGELKQQIEIKEWASKPQWEPVSSDVSAAGDLGYTYGRLQHPVTDAGSDKKISISYYQTIWKKDAQGNWKVAVGQGLVMLDNLKQKPLEQKIDMEKLDKNTREVVAVEHAFSNHSQEKGMADAFYHFIAETGIALSPMGPPRTKETYAKILAAQKQKDTDVRKSTLVWEAMYSFVSSSGDLAYNYGSYTYTVNDTSGTPRVGKGYFVTAWKKQPDQSWKFVVDGGNQY